MKPTRRDLAFLLPALATASASAQEAPAALPSKSFKFDDLPVKASGEGGLNKSRAVMHGVLHNGFGLDIHETELPPGAISHPPHRHVYEEAFVILEGTLEYFNNGTRTVLGPGSIGFAGSNDEHGVKNVGATSCRYAVFELGVGGTIK